MILELKDVQAYYDKSHILNGVNLSVEEGNFCLPAGPQRCRQIHHDENHHGHAEPERTL